MTYGNFRNKFAEAIFLQKYAHNGCETWPKLARCLVEDVCGIGVNTDKRLSPLLNIEEMEQLIEYIVDFKFIPGGRYLYYAGRAKKYFNNCYLLRAEEDTREDWANLMWKSVNCLMTGGGIGIDYSRYRSSLMTLKGTGGISSGPIPAMFMVNEAGRNVMQGGSRRSAIYGSLKWNHGDIHRFLHAKDWHAMKILGTDITIAQAKEADFNYPAPLDMTNISANYDTDWLMSYLKTGDYGEIFKINVEQAMKTGDPGFSFNFFGHENETLRNACTEVTSEDDSDVCNLGSINLSMIENIQELAEVTELATKFLICGTLRADLPYQKVADVRAKNRRLGLGLMGVHEWLLRGGHNYAVTEELHEWLSIYRGQSDKIAKSFSDDLSVSRPVAVRSIAPTGTIGIMACTTTGIEPIYAVAFKRRFLKNGTDWHYQYVVDPTAEYIINEYSCNPSSIETAIELAMDPERRMEVQADIQEYVDMSISSTINLPAWGSEHNNPDKVDGFAKLLAKYAQRLRGFTVYPDGARGGQPLTECDYYEAKNMEGETFFEATDVCSITGKGGTCGG